MANSKSVLDITTLHTEPKFVTIDGSQYELIPKHRIKYGHQIFIFQAQKGIAKILADGAKAPVSDEEYDAATHNMERCVKRVLDAPANVISKLSADQQQEIVNSWVDENPGTPKKKRKPGRKRSKKRSPGSSDSTAAPPKDG